MLPHSFSAARLNFSDKCTFFLCERTCRKFVSAAHKTLLMMLTVTKIFMTKNKMFVYFMQFLIWIFSPKFSTGLFIISNCDFSSRSFDFLDNLTRNKFSNFCCCFYRKNATNLERFQLSISKKEMYPKNDRAVQALVQDMIRLPIVHIGKCRLSRRTSDSFDEIFIGVFNSIKAAVKRYLLFVNSKKCANFFVTLSSQ